jgi:acyl carrier protein
MTTQLAAWIAEITETPAPTLTPETDLVADLGLDSLVLAELGAKLRTTYKIKLRPGELREDLRVGRIIEVVQSKMAG